MKKIRFCLLMTIGLLLSAVSSAYDPYPVRPECIMDSECSYGMKCVNKFCKIIENEGEPNEGEDEDGFVQRTLGCSGGEKKCFTGTISFKGLAISGTWYKS